MSNCLQLVDFVIGLVNSGFNLPDGQVKFWFVEFILQKNSSSVTVTVINPAQQKFSGDELKFSG